jgi:probable addiction module antidote protein
MKNIAAFDAADYLDNDIVIAEYLNAALEDQNPNVFLQAIADVAKARGMSKLAKDTGLGRESLYKALAPGAKPRYDTVLKLVRALGVELHTTPAHAGRPNNAFKPKLRGSA